MALFVWAGRAFLQFETFDVPLHFIERQAQFSCDLLERVAQTEHLDQTRLGAGCPNLI